jgi:general secretion pathway protein C
MAASTMCLRILYLPLLALCAWIVAGTVNFRIAQGTRFLPDLRGKGQVHAPLASLRTPKAEDNGVIVRLNLFGSAVTRKSPGDPPPAGGAGLSACTLPLALVGTVVATEPGWSLALITDLPRKETGVYRATDRLGEAEVVSIQGQRVILHHQDHLVFLELRPDPASTGPQERASGPTGMVLSGIRREGNRVLVERGLMDRVLADPGAELSNVRVLPVFRDGGGLKVYSIRPGSLLSEAGLQNGDLLTRVDGFSLDSPDRILEILQRLKHATEVELEFSRQGQPQKLTFQIR